jgi:citrate synthase
LNEVPHGREISMWISSREAIARLGIKRETLYAYVSRGLVRSEPGEGRARRFRRDDVERLARQGRNSPRDPGASLVVESAVSVIEHGRLLYRGIDVTELAGSQSFESVSALLWDRDVDPWSWSTSGPWARALATTSAASPAGALPLERLMLAVATIATIDAHHFDGDLDAVVERAPRVVAALADSLGPLSRARRAGGAPIAERVARNLSDRSPSDELVRLVDLALVLVADHGLAAPTMAARLVASVGADLHAAVLAGCCAMRGSAPGATALAVEELLGESPASKPAVLVAARLERGEPVPGIGHPLYPDHDPRAAHLLRELRGSYDGHPALDVVTGLADALTAAGQPAPNLDFALGARPSSRSGAWPASSRTAWSSTPARRATGSMRSMSGPAPPPRTRAALA